MTEKKRIQLETAFNTRDLGGYTTVSEAKTSDVFVRSDCFIPMNENDRDTLQQLGIKTVVDLRDPFETKRLPSIFMNVSGVDYNNMPVFGSNSLPEDLGEEASMRFVMGDFYITIVDKHQTQLQGILKKMASVPDGKIMFHCSAGKDRTGILSALLLGVAEVDHQTIVDDYALTEVMLKDRMDDLRKGAGIKDEVSVPFADELLAAKPESMEKLLTHFNQHYSGIPAYLKTIGLSSEDISQLKSKMIV